MAVIFRSRTTKSRYTMMLYYMTAFILRHLNIIIHGLGFYVLICVIKTKGDRPQLLYIHNLNLVQLLRNIVGLPKMYFEIFDSNKLDNIWPYVIINLRVTSEFLFYIFIIFLIVDRLLMILLKSRYQARCTSLVAKRCLVVTWFFCMSLGVSLSILYHYGKYEISSPYIYYIHLVLDIKFIILAVITYGALICFFKRSPVGNRQMRGSLSTLLIILCFVLFTITTDVIDLRYQFSGKRVPPIWFNLRFVLFNLADFADGIIYVFFNRLVYQKMCGCRPESSDRPRNRPSLEIIG